MTTVGQSLRFLQGHLALLRDQGWDVHVSANPGTALTAVANTIGVDAHPISMTRTVDALGDVAALTRMTALIRRLRPEVVSGHTPKGGLVAMTAARVASVPVRTYHMHGLPQMSARGIRRTLLAMAERQSCRAAHRVFPVSPSLAEQAISLGLCDPKKVEVIGNGSIAGVDTAHRFNPRRLAPDARRATRDRIGIPADAPVVGFVGRIVPDKGICDLLTAWRIVRSQRPDAHLVLAGPLDGVQPLPDWCASGLTSDPSIHQLGRVDTVPEVLAGLDVFVLPSHREGFGVSLIEAAAMELPVIATMIPGCVDTLDPGSTGILTPARDPQALAAAIESYLADPALRRRHGTAGRARAARLFEASDCQRAFVGVYSRLVAGVTRPARDARGG